MGEPFAYFWNMGFALIDFHESDLLFHEVINSEVSEYTPKELFTYH